MQHLETFPSHFLVGALAAASFECLRLYSLRNRLSAKQYTRLKKSSLNWIVVAGMLAASGFFAWVFYAERPDATAAQLAFSGIAARSLIRDGAAALTAKKPVTLGNGNEDKPSIRDIFQ